MNRYGRGARYVAVVLLLFRVSLTDCRRNPVIIVFWCRLPPSRRTLVLWKRHGRRSLFDASRQSFAAGRFYPYRKKSSYGRDPKRRTDPRPPLPAVTENRFKTITSPERHTARRLGQLNLTANILFRVEYSLSRTLFRRAQGTGFRVSLLVEYVFFCIF